MTTQLGAPDTPGATPPGYTTGRLLGRGGSGTVYEARHHSTGRSVALKVLDLDVVGPEMQRRFARERAAMSGLADHPHIVSILDAGWFAGRPWLAMSLCEGGSLASLRSPVPPAHALTLLHAIGSALATAHAQGVLHCDVKPGNILLTAYGQPALSDFGIARLTLESQGSRIGGYTLDHVPPEIIRGERPSDRGDIWSLGTSLWQLLAGRPPFRENDDVAPALIMRRIENDPLPALRRREIPTELKDLLEQMTAKDPFRRPGADEVVRRAAELARADGHALGTPLPLPGRRAATETWSGSVPPQLSSPSVSGPPVPRPPHPDEDAVTGRIPVTARAATSTPPPAPVAAPTMAPPVMPPPVVPPPAMPPPAMPPVPTAVSPTQPPPPRRRRWGLILSSLAILVIASMVGGGVLTYRYGPARTVTAPPTTVTVTAAPAPASPAANPTPAPNASAPGGVAPLFLAQVQEVDSTGTLTKQAFGINGRFYPQSINVGTNYSSTTPAGIDYLLNRQYRTFSTAFGIADNYSGLSTVDETPPTCTLQVLVDDRPLGPARTATRDTPVLLENLDVSGGLRLRLLVTQNGQSSSSSSSSANAADYPCTLGNPVVAG
ncbi:protein kinase domain-containing protein [Actinomycetospora aeridis]|uniref:non-specific serine/threonine protein kinase n=1 Tax=Actinomycetospora aeridis TaxID=3129231 RepID=A0ABU8N693_9PSEU